MNRCRACGAALRWATTKAGKKMPLNLDYDPTGNVWLRPGVSQVVHVGKDATPPMDLPDDAIGPFMPHHATCPNVEAFQG